MTIELNRDRAIRPAILGALLALSVGSGAVRAEDVARWVDAQGVTHFGNPHLAPMDARRISVAAANAMVVPVPGPEGTRLATGPSWTKLTLPPKKNKKGWRPRKESLYTGTTTGGRGRR